MGLEEPELDLEQLLNNAASDGSDEDDDISDLSKKELYDKVMREGQVNIGENRAIIKCPVSKTKKNSVLLGGTYRQDRNYICPLAVRPAPDASGEVTVCNGPYFGVGTWRCDGNQEELPGRGPFDSCTYSPSRFEEEDENDDPFE